jgi:hypothetical protein
MHARMHPHRGHHHRNLYDIRFRNRDAYAHESMQRYAYWKPFKEVNRIELEDKVQTTTGAALRADPTSAHRS